MNDVKSFGLWLKERRQSLGMTQEDFAEKVGCAHSTIEKIERGLRRPSHQIAERMAEALSIPSETRAQFTEWARGLPVDYLSGLPVDFPRTPEGAAEEQDTNPVDIGQALPAPLTDIIGRERDLLKVIDILSRAGVRLLTLLGPPGIGKTRLSLALASVMRDSFEDGVFFVPLAPLHDAHLFAATIAAHIGVKEVTSRDIEESLTDYLRRKKMLLVLDNFEQIVEAAPSVAKLLAAAPNLKILVTSRALLNIYGEHEYPVPPLELPDLLHLPDLAALEQNPAIMLFVQRAKAANNHFELTSENVSQVASVCVRLDGLPLCIELAAARSKIFTPGALLRQMEQRLKLLTGGPSDRDPRQQNLRGAIAWSYDLLNPDEQRLFRRLSVFSGGCLLEGAEAVCGAPVDGSGNEGGGDNKPVALTIEVSPVIESLVSKSLVGVIDIAGDMRFGMLETLREYASEQLVAEGEAEQLRNEHANYFMALAEDSEAKLRGPEQGEAHKRLDQEHDNLRAALEWLLEQNEGEMAQRLSGALWRFWNLRGYPGEGRMWLARALALPPKRGTSWAKAANGAGNLAQAQMDYVEARALHEAALSVYTELGDKGGSARILNNLGLTSWSQSDYPAARTYLQECLVLQRQAGSTWDVGAALTNLGLVAMDEGAVEDALKFQEEALSLFKELGDTVAYYVVLNNIGVIVQQQGDNARALSIWEECLAYNTKLENKHAIALVLGNLSLLARNEGKYDEARALAAKCIASYLQEGSIGLIAHVLARFGGMSVLEGDSTKAAHLFGASDAILHSAKVAMPPAIQKDREHYAAIACETLGDEEYKAAWKVGYEMPIEQAIALALNGESLRESADLEGRLGVK